MWCLFLLTAFISFVNGQSHLHQDEPPYGSCEVEGIGGQYVTTNMYKLSNGSSLVFQPMTESSNALYIHMMFPNIGLFKLLIIGEMMSLDKCSIRKSMCTRVNAKNIKTMAPKVDQWQQLIVTFQEDYAYLTLSHVNVMIFPIEENKLTGNESWYALAEEPRPTKTASNVDKTYSVQVDCHHGVETTTDYPATHYTTSRDGKKITLNFHRFDFTTEHTTAKVPNVQYNVDQLSGKKSEASMSIVGIIVGILIACLVAIGIIFLIVKAVKSRQSMKVNEKTQLQEEGTK